MKLRPLVILALLTITALSCAPVQPVPTVTVTATAPPITVTVTPPPPPPITVTVTTTPSPTVIAPEPYYMHSLIIDASAIVEAITKFGVIYSQASIPSRAPWETRHESWTMTVVKIRAQAEALRALLKQYEAGGLDREKARIQTVTLGDAVSELMQLTYDGEKYDAQSEMHPWKRVYVIERYEDYRIYIEPMIAKVNRILEKLPIVQPG